MYFSDPFALLSYGWAVGFGFSALVYCAGYFGSFGWLRDKATKGGR